MDERKLTVLQNAVYGLFEEIAKEVATDDIVADSDSAATGVRFIIERFMVNSFISALVLECIAGISPKLVEDMYDNPHMAQEALFTIMKTVSGNSDGIIDVCIHWRESSLSGVIEYLEELNICPDLLETIKGMGLKDDSGTDVPQAIIDEISRIVGIPASSIESAVKGIGVAKGADGRTLNIVALNADDIEIDDEPEDEQSIDDFWSNL